MPAAKQKPSEIAAEAKRNYIPYCESNYPQFPPNSILFPEARQLVFSPTPVDPSSSRLRVAVVEGDPVDIAFDWYDYEVAIRSASTAASGAIDTDASTTTARSAGGTTGLVQPIPVVNAANEKRPGGDWELGLIASEENLCRRSNLVQCLSTPWNGGQSQPPYPMPNYGGIYSPNVVVFRSGPDKTYSVWPEFRRIPVISVAPSRRPKLDGSGERYSFSDEANHVKNKIRTILRIAADRNHRDIVVGPWGLGHIYRNPPRELARMWSDVLFQEKEFENRFSNVVFAIDSHIPSGGGGAGTSAGGSVGAAHGVGDAAMVASSSSGAAAAVAAPGTASEALNEFEIFREELDASNVHKEGFKLRIE